jgi:hypothetical protein
MEQPHFGALEAMKKRETLWLTDAESVVQASSVIISKSE